MGSFLIPANFVQRGDLKLENLQVYDIPFERWRVHDAFGTLLPATPANDDLGLIGGTFGTAAPTIQTGDAKAASVTRRARALIYLPPEYQAGESVSIRAYAGMKTTVADTSATIDFEVYSSDLDETVSADLCTTAAQSINSLTLANKDFVITPTNLAPGSILDVRMTIAIVDSATATAVIGLIGRVALLADIRG